MQFENQELENIDILRTPPNLLDDYDVLVLYYVLVLAGERWDLGSDRFHVMLARGRVDEFGDMMIHESKIVSAAAKGLGEVGALQSKSRLFIYLHGAFMLGAWICSASLGIIMAR